MTAIAGVTTGSGDVNITNGDVVFGTAGKGIVLGATSNTNANTLDDYEEGTWTPAGSNKDVNAKYTKIGRKVICEFYYAGHDADPGGTLATMTGLPFTSRSDTRDIAGGVVTSTVGGPYASRVINNSSTYNIVSANTNQRFADNVQVWGLIIYRVP